MPYILNSQIWVYKNLFSQKTSASILLDKSITYLIIANLVALLAEHIPTIFVKNESAFALFDQISIYIFTVEFLLRLYAASGDPKYQGKSFAGARHSITFMALVDLLVIAPYWLHLLGLFTMDLRILRGLRLLRVLKLLKDVLPALQEFKIANTELSFQKKVNALMNETPTSGRLHKQLDMFLIFVIILSITCVFLETVPEVYQPLKIQFLYLDVFSVIIFTIEYLMRMIAASEQFPTDGIIRSRVKHFFKASTLVDFIAVAPFYLQYFGFIDLRFLRILRTLKLTRYNTAFLTFTKVLNREKKAIGAALFVTFLLTIFSAAIAYEFEHEAQPEKFDTMVRAIYWAVISLASVGYGDIYPITPIGQAFTIFLSIMGIGIVALPAGILGSGFSDQLQQDREEMLLSVEEAFADGDFTSEESETLELERIRLHLSVEQFEKIKARALAKQQSLSNQNSFIHAAEYIVKAHDLLRHIDHREALVDINNSTLSEQQKSALRGLLG